MKIHTNNKQTLPKKSMLADLLARPLQTTVVVMLVIVGIYFAASLLKELFTGSAVFKGSHYDFLAFYSAASLTLHGHIQQIFNTDILTNFQRQIIAHPVGASGYMPFLNPPYVAVLLVPLALLSIAKARLVWLVINVVLMTWITYWLTRQLAKRWRIAGTILLLGTFPVYQSMINGQLSVLMLFGCVMAYISAERHKLILSGFWLSLLWLKPQFAVFAIIGLVITRQWRVAASMLGTLLGLAVVMLPITGIASYFTYGRFMLGVLGDHFNGAGAIIPSAWRGSLNTAAGLNGFYAALVGQTNVQLVNFLTGLSSVGLVVLFVLAARKVRLSLNGNKERLMLAAAIAASLLINPHLYAQDVILLYMLLPMLAGFKYYLRTIIVIVLACDLIKIDQANRLHIFTALLTLFVIIIFVKIITDSKFLLDPAKE